MFETVFTDIVGPIFRLVHEEYGAEAIGGRCDWSDDLEEFREQAVIGPVGMMTLGCAEALMNGRARALESLGANPHVSTEKRSWSKLLSDTEILEEFKAVRRRLGGGDSGFVVETASPIGEYFSTEAEVTRFARIFAASFEEPQSSEIEFETVAYALSIFRGENPPDRCNSVHNSNTDYSNNPDYSRMHDRSGNSPDGNSAHSSNSIYSNNPDFSYLIPADFLADERVVNFCMLVLAEYPELEKIVRRWQSDPQRSNPTHSGDGYISCEKCHAYHWGKNGAAGILVRAIDEYGQVTHLLLQLRSLSVSKGGTWGIPGGALSDGESALEGALREAHEEANIKPEQIKIIGQQVHDHGNWRFTTFFATERSDNLIRIVNVDSEAIATRWVAVDELPKLPLLHHFNDELHQALADRPERA